MKPKSRSTYFLAAFALVMVYVAVIAPLRAAARKRARVETHMLDIIKDQVANHLDSGGAWPTNWLTLSNALVGMKGWETVEKIARGAASKDPSELYLVLSRRVDWSDQYRSIFLVGSEPHWNPGQGRGRWIAGVSYGLTNCPYSFPFCTNTHSWRTWVAEKHFEKMPPEVRIQIAEASERTAHAR